MSSPATGVSRSKTPQFMRELGVSYWLNKPLEQLEHEASSLSEEQHWRVWALILRCSYCFPHQQQYAVRPKFRDGTFEDWCRQFQLRVSKKRAALPLADAMSRETTELDPTGEPRPLRAADICLALGWDWDAHRRRIFRALAKLREMGLLKVDFPFYPEPRPSTIPPVEIETPLDGLDDSTGHLDNLGESQKTLRYNIADIEIIVTSTVTPEGQYCLPADAVRWAERVRTEYLAELSALRNRVRTRIREESTAHGILIVKNRKDKKSEEGGGEEEENAPPPPPVVQSPPEPEPEPTAEVIVLTREQHEQESGWKALVQIVEGCGKPVPGHQAAECRREFFKHPLSVQKRIVEDAQHRAHLVWNIPRFTPSLLTYLTSGVWDTEPVKPRTLPTKANARAAHELHPDAAAWCEEVYRKSGGGE